MDRLIILAFDPGITTGIATGIIRPNEPMEVGAEEHRLDVSDFFDYLAKRTPDIIIYESFEFRSNARKGLVLFSKELIGVTRLYSHQSGCKIYSQTAYQGKTYFTNKMLKEHNVYKTGMGHAMDATRHLLQWYTFGPGYRYNTKGFGPA